MTKDEITRMAREAGMFTHKEVQPELERFAALVAEHERKECALIAWNYEPDEGGRIETAIRARSNT